MFDNVGAQLKTWAKISCWAGIMASIVAGIVLIISGIGSAVVTGVITLVLGSLASWIAALGIYGFGEIVENSNIRTEFACEAHEKQKNNQ